MFACFENAMLLVESGPQTTGELAWRSGFCLRLSFIARRPGVPSIRRSSWPIDFKAMSMPFWRNLILWTRSRWLARAFRADTIKRLMESAEAVIEQQRQATKGVFIQACTDADIALVESGAMSSGQPSVAWREVTGQSEDVVPEKALCSDLVVSLPPGPRWPPPCVRPSRRSC